MPHLRLRAVRPLAVAAARCPPLSLAAVGRERAQAGPPPNHHFGHARTRTGGPTAVDATTVEATAEPGEPRLPDESVDAHRLVLVDSGT